MHSKTVVKENGGIEVHGIVVGGLVVKALDCGVRGHRFESHLGRVFHLDFLLEFSLPTGEDLI